MSDNDGQSDGERAGSSRQSAKEVKDIAVIEDAALEPHADEGESPGTLEIYEGPIPRPKDLLSYNDVREGLAGDIAQNYLEECEFRRKLEQQRFEDGRESSRANRSLARQEFELNADLNKKELVLQGRSQWMAFMLAVLALGVTAFGFYIGASLSAIPFIMVTISILAARFIGRDDMNAEIRLLTAMVKDARQKALPRSHPSIGDEPVQDTPVPGPERPTEPEQEIKHQSP